MADTNYSTIQDPYNGFLERSNPDYGLSPSDGSGANSDGTSDSAAANAAGTNSGAYVGSNPVSQPSDIAPSSVSSQSISDLIITSSIQSRNYQPQTLGFKINGATGAAEFNNTVFISNVVVTTLAATSGTIGGFVIGGDYLRDSANSFGLSSTETGANDVRFWAGDTLANKATAPFQVLQDGSVVAANIVITGGSVDSSVLVGNIGSAVLNIADRGWTQTCVFSVTDADTIAWAAGTFTTSDGTSYSIGAGNTGNMAAKTYIYLDINVSNTAYQHTTVASSAVGAGKVMIGVAQNDTTEATFQTFGGVGGQNIDASNIVAGSITGNEIAASTISAAKMNVTQLSAIAADLGNITAGTITMPSGGYIRSGQTAWDSGTGFFLGNVGGITKFSIGDGSANKVTWDGSTLTITGSISATTGTVGGFNVGADYLRDVANSFGLASTVTGGDDVRFWAGSSFASRATAPFHVFESGVVVGNNITITGGSVDSSTLNGDIPQSALNIANRGWTQTSVFSVTDADTVAWGAGTFTSADGTSYSISSGNTGNMAAKTYIFLDINASTTAYQLTTTAVNAVGLGRVLIAVCQNNATEATFQLFGGNGGMNIDASNIVTGSITSNEIAAGTITAAKLSVSQLSAISADLGNITAGTITMPTGGYIRSGQTAYDTGTGFFLGNVSGVSKFSIGDGSANKVTWDGSTLTITGSISATTGTIGGFNVGADYVRDVANSFGLASTVTGSDDVRFWAGDTFANRATADFSVTESGLVTASNIVVTGGSIDATVLNGILNQANLDIANRGWSQTSVFTAPSVSQVNWGAGTFITASGTTYSISSGNTGTMSAKTYVYFDVGVSTTAYQHTTVAATAVGAGKVLIAVAQNNSNEATFQVFGGGGGLNVDGANIVAASVTTNEIAASTITANNIAAGTITAAKMSVSQLSAIAADLGAITAGTIVLPSGGYVRSGQTAYDTGTGFFLGNVSGTPKFSIGNSSADKLVWDGTALTVTGDITGSTITGGKFQTAASGQRVVIDSGGTWPNSLELYNSSSDVILDFGTSSSVIMRILPKTDDRYGLIIQNDSSLVSNVGGLFAVDVFNSSSNSRAGSFTNEGAGDTLQVSPSGTGNGLIVNSAGAGASTAPLITINQFKNGRSLYINNSGSPSTAAAVIENSAQNTRALYISQSNPSSNFQPLYIDSAGLGASFINATNTGAQTALEIDINSAGHPPLFLVQNAATNTHFKCVLRLHPVNIWISDGTTPNGNLQGFTGDFCFNGPGGHPFYATSGGSPNWTQL